MKATFIRLICPIAAAALMAAGCGSSKNETVTPPLVLEKGPTHMAGGGEAHIMPKAIAYRMSGNWADYVPVTMNSSRTEIISYPAPTDLTAQSAPLALADGYWLDRRGITSGSVFTRYTYDEYRALQTAPTLSQLRSSLIPGAVVTEIVEFPFTLQEAMSDTTLCNRMLTGAAPGIKVLYQAPSVR